LQHFTNQLRKGIVRKVDSEDGVVNIYVQLEVEPGMCAKLNQQVLVTPKPDKAEYTSTRKSLDKWAKQYEDHDGEYHEQCPFRFLLLNSEENIRVGKPIRIEQRTESLTIQESTNNMITSLNKYQVRLICTS